MPISLNGALPAPLPHRSSRSSLSAKLQKIIEAQTSRLDATPEHASHDFADIPLLAALPIGVIIRGSYGEILAHNPESEALLGLNEQQLKGAAPLPAQWKLIHPNGQDCKPTELPTYKVLTTRQELRDLALGVISEREPCRWLSITATPVFDAQRRLLGAIAVLSSIDRDESSCSCGSSSTQAAPSVLDDTGSQASPTLSEIAKASGFAVATVSMALRNRSRISQATRDKIQSVAKNLGYRPDPTLSKLMRTLRTGRAVAFKSVIHAFTTITEQEENHYVKGVAKGARERAAELGYALKINRLIEGFRPNATLQHHLFMQGVEGLLLLPCCRPISCSEWLDWSRFSVVSIHGGLIGPEFDQVVLHWFSSMRTILDKLLLQGYQNIGVLLQKELDTIVGHKLTAALAAHQAANPESLLTICHFHAPLMSDHGCSGPCTRATPIPPLEVEKITRWLATEQPDAIAITGCMFLDELLELIKEPSNRAPKIAVLDLPDGKPLAGTKEYPALVGATAIDLLNDKILTGTRGLPLAPATTMIRGQWVDHETARPPPLVSDLRPTGGAASA